MMKILIIEDEQELAGSLKKNLMNESISADIALDGYTGLSMAETKSYDLIILDWRIPGLEGIEVCKILRNNKNFTPIILLTAFNNVSNKISALENGADDYITKPFNFDELLARIHAVLRRSKSYNDTIYFYSYKLQISKRKFLKNDEEIQLTDKEFDVLIYMIENSNKIISKETLANEVWEIPYFANTNFIEATIKNLRKKIEDEKEKKIIKNVYGEGYILIMMDND